MTSKHPDESFEFKQPHRRVDCPKQRCNVRRRLILVCQSFSDIMPDCGEQLPFSYVSARRAIIRCREFHLLSVAKVIGGHHLSCSWPCQVKSPRVQCCDMPRRLSDVLVCER